MNTNDNHIGRRQLPPLFIERMAAMGLDDVVEALATTSPSVAIRANRAKGGGPPEDAAPVAWNQDGFYLPGRPAFTLDPHLHQGLYYVQDASSMALRRAVERAMDAIGSDRPLRYLDACAAPGGKTTAAIDALPEDAFVIANEFDPRRASVLVENLAKWGRPAIVTRGDASRVKGMDGFFDVIAADMPCSGEGMMRKETAAIEQWSPGLVADCAALQRDIALSLWDCLAPGGVMVYSTCTFNTAENEENIQWMIDNLGAEPMEIPSLDSAPGISGAVGGYGFPAYRFMPGRTRGEGLFMAMLRKPAEGNVRNPKPAKLKACPAPGAFLESDWTYFSDGTAVRAIPTAHAPLMAHVAKNMNVVSAGLELGETKGKDFIPAQALAMTVGLRQEVFPTYDVDRETALSYLRRDAIAADGAPRGIVLLKYDGHPLGFVKNLGNRANNLYPANWRIRIL